MKTKLASIRHELLYEKRDIANGILVFLMMLEFAFGLVVVSALKKGDPFSDVVDFAINDISMLFLLILTIVCFSRRYADRRQNFFFCTMLIVAYTGQFFASVAFSVQGFPQYAKLQFFSLSVNYFVLFLTWLMFWLYQNEVLTKNKVDRKITTALAFILLVLLLVQIYNAFSHNIFYIDSAGKVVYTSLSIIYPIYDGLILCCYLFIVLRSKASIHLKHALLSYLIFPAIASVVDAVCYKLDMPNNTDPFGNLCVTVAIYFVFFNVYSDQGRELMQKERELQESRINAMILQVNPHFIYNALGSVESLCQSDPERAAALVRDFSEYLRGNYSNMTSDPMIPFKNELAHLQSYLNIEKVRFPNIEILFDLKCVDFELPCLSVQPLVENAIKHGVCKRRRSRGTIVVSSWEEAEGYHIRVLDDGVGFSAYPENDGKPHVGVSNVRRRLAMLCEGSLIINSVPGEGTVSEIFIPKTEDKK